MLRNVLLYCMHQIWKFIGQLCHALHYTNISVMWNRAVYHYHDCTIDPLTGVLREVVHGQQLMCNLPTFTCCYVTLA